MGVAGEAEAGAGPLRPAAAAAFSALTAAAVAAAEEMAAARLARRLPPPPPAPPPPRPAAKAPLALAAPVWLPLSDPSPGWLFPAPAPGDGTPAHAPLACCEPGECTHALGATEKIPETEAGNPLRGATVHCEGPSEGVRRGGGGGASGRSARREPRPLFFAA